MCSKERDGNKIWNTQLKECNNMKTKIITFDQFKHAYNEVLAEIGPDSAYSSDNGAIEMFATICADFAEEAENDDCQDTLRIAEDFEVGLLIELYFQFEVATTCEFHTSDQLGNFFPKQFDTREEAEAAKVDLGRKLLVKCKAAKCECRYRPQNGIRDSGS
jgi:hypothetical protein